MSVQDISAPALSTPAAPATPETRGAAENPPGGRPEKTSGDCELPRIRAMKKEDCRETAALMKRCFSVPWSEKSLNEMFETAGYLSLVAEGEEGIEGYIGVKAVFDEADITNVAVLPEKRRRKTAARLLAALLAASGEQGIRTIYLEVRASNGAAIALYEQAGFVKSGVRKNYYEKPAEDALLMQRTENC